MSIVRANHDGRDVHSRRLRRVALDTVGPQHVDGSDLLLRRARISDGPPWRAARLRDAHRLRAAFGDDVSLTDWVDHVLADRRQTRQGSLEPLLAVDGRNRVVGECSFAIDGRSGLAECSMWTVSQTTHVQTTWVIVSAALWLLERRPTIPWIVAPVAVGNPGPARMLTASGFERAAVARQLRVYDGVPTDHDIWRLENTPAVRERLRVLAAG